MQTFLEKISSRKFWMAVAAFLASIGASIGGMATYNENLAIAGAICAMLSAAIYAAAEAYADGKRAEANVTVTNITTTKTIGATSTTAKDVVEKILTNDISSTSQE